MINRTADIIRKNYKEIDNIVENVDKVDKFLSKEFSNYSNEHDDAKEYFNSVKDKIEDEVITKLEINNLDSYIDTFNEQIKSIKKSLEESKDIDSKKLKDSQELLDRLIRFKEDLEGLFSLKKLDNFKFGYYKENRGNYKVLERNVLNKLETYQRTTFTNPKKMYISLKKVFGNSTARKYTYKLYRYINRTNLFDSSIYVYFLILAVSSVGYKEMKGRDELIENLKRLLD